MTLKNTIIIIVVILVLLAYLVLKIRREEKERAKKALLRADAEAARDNSIELDYHQAYSIAGINKRGLDMDRDCGAFHGYVVRDKDNQYDRHAIAVFKGTKQHVGYIPADNSCYLSKDLDEIGGQCPCIMEIKNVLDEDEHRRFFTGRVQILWPDTE